MHAVELKQRDLKIKRPSVFVASVRSGAAWHNLHFFFAWFVLLFFVLFFVVQVCAHVLRD